MKHILLIGLLVVAGTTFAQKNSVVGKWGFAAISTPDFSIDLENPAATKKYLADEVKKESGTVPDSAQLEMAYNMMSMMFKEMSFDFAADGKAVFTAMGEDGGPKTESVKYTVDYAKGTLTTIETEDGKEKNETVKIRFEGDYLIMENTVKGETVKVKRVK